MAAPQHRHQDLLKSPLFANEQQRAQAIERFRRLVHHFEAAAAKEPAASTSDRDGYKNSLLGAFFHSLALEMPVLGNSDDIVVADHFRLPLLAFADYLVTHFFLPLQAAANKTPQLSPVSHAAVQQAQMQGGQQRNISLDSVGTPEQLSALRGSCLDRDRHGCVVTHTFDRNLLKDRLQRPPARDDDGNLLDGLDTYGGLESLDMHQAFRQHDIVFEPVLLADGPPNNGSYRIDSFFPSLFANHLPVTRTLVMHPSIEPPSERLLALHSAFGHILHLSGAGDYIQSSP
ncbi:hypothetical protein B0T22DRAFT_478390 [Podospora appendiculata]|uniref:HNH nuclease domain-containing protein n=1 Tax=Podospora appendiculata TaxID=314037 RepID=A0AAE0XLP5_9PEZI|nr:hypothetical protein B0T22DRAFT_478390 [Podospora appendiculata]